MERLCFFLNGLKAALIFKKKRKCWTDNRVTGWWNETKLELELAQGQSRSPSPNSNWQWFRALPCISQAQVLPKFFSVWCSICFFFFTFLQETLTCEWETKSVAYKREETAFFTFLSPYQYGSRHCSFTTNPTTLPTNTAHNGSFTFLPYCDWTFIVIKKLNGKISSDKHGVRTCNLQIVLDVVFLFRSNVLPLNCIHWPLFCQ